MHNYSNTTHVELTLTDRQNIERWHNRDGLSNRNIAVLLDKAPQTINDEINRGLVQMVRKTKYSAQQAQEIHDENKSHCGRPSKLTEKLNRKISAMIREKFSLEVIHKLLKLDVTLRTLYNWVEKGWLDVSYDELLYPHYKKAKKLRKTQPKHVLGTSIEERPDFINDRSEAGHWEIDTVILTKEKNMCLLTLTDRKTRFELIRLIPDKSAQSVNFELSYLKTQHEFKSITSDNGKEFARLKDVLDCPVYYCHAYASFERGTNENHNRMIRRHIPKGTKKTTKEFVAYVQWWINNYPRRMFSYKSVYEMLRG